MLVLLADTTYFTPEEAARILADTEYERPVGYVHSGLAPTTRYYWRLRAIDTTDVAGDWSPVHQFTTDSLRVRRYYYLSDHLGSVRATVNEDGEVVHYDDYYAFGQPMPRRSEVNGTYPKERFTGHELDTETDLYYAGARYLDPVIGRWMAIDPLADQYPEWSPFNYSLNNPLLFFDPTGTYPTCGSGSSRGDVETSEQNCDAVYQIGATVTNVYGTFIYLGNNQWQNKTLGEVKSISDIIAQYGAVNPESLNKNFIGHYVGPHNPETYEGEPVFFIPPRSLAEFPAIQHDIAYGGLGIAGAEGLLFDQRAIAADWIFVQQELSLASISMGHGDGLSALQAGGAGVGLGIFATPKTVAGGVNSIFNSVRGGARDFVAQGVSMIRRLYRLP